MIETKANLNEWVVRAGELLNEILADVRKEHPDAEWYATPGNLNLMSGPSHDGRSGTRPRQDRVLASVVIRGLDAGDW